MQFKENSLREFWDKAGVPRPKEIPAQRSRSVLRKLQMIDAASNINDLRVPPGNHLEKLKGDREGQHSIKVNDQYRICFIWDERAQEAKEVEFVDYH